MRFFFSFFYKYYRVIPILLSFNWINFNLTRDQFIICNKFFKRVYYLSFESVSTYTGNLICLVSNNLEE